jgi:manganese-dependent inorganic pyrophosphatase
MKFMESGLVPSQPVAGVLLSGILSDTLSLKMSTTTHRDIQAVKYLAPLAGEDPDLLGSDLLERGMDLAGIPLEIILSRDTKDYTLYGKKVMISQVMVPSFCWNRERDDVIHAELARMRVVSGSDMVLVLFTNVQEKSSDLYGSADPDLLNTIFGKDLPVRFEGVMSRKLDFLPWLGQRLRGQVRS